ncbi:MAG: AAA family ATPase [Proteobacteria bacterium]|nr:AAA family ATPase [Pseudomonadota bacterium]
MTELEQFALDEQTRIVDGPHVQFLDSVVGATDQDGNATKPRWHRAPSLVAVILDRAREPWVPLTLGGDEIAKVRAGGIAVVMGPTGAGKTSLVAGLLVHHARELGPVVVLSRELPADELAARAIGMQCDASWIDVLIGNVSRFDMDRVLNLPRMVVLERRDATLAQLNVAIVAMKAEHPTEPVLVAVDYVQILESDECETRAKVADVIAQIDDIAREHRVVVLAISQMSRASSRAARNGESVGADSTDGGAESAAIERVASITLAIGSSSEEREDGTRAVDLSIGKGRMTGGDRVIPMSYLGRSGLWRVAGDARPAGDVRAERQGARDVAKQTAAELAIMGAAAKATEPKTREDMTAVAACTKSVRRLAMAALLGRGELVEVQKKKPRSRAWMVCTPALADSLNIPIATGGDE